MEQNYGVLYDGIFGDISLSVVNGIAEIDMEVDYGSYLLNMIRGRLKSIDGDYGSASRFNIYKNIGSANSRDKERAMVSSVKKMLTFDNLVALQDLEVISMIRRHEMLIGIKVNGRGVNRKSILSMVINRTENGRAE